MKVSASHPIIALLTFLQGARPSETAITGRELDPAHGSSPASVKNVSPSRQTPVEKKKKGNVSQGLPAPLASRR